MRFYNITLSKNGVRQFNLQFNEKNPYALGIKFNIQSFYESSNYTPSVLVIYNPITSFFSQSQGLKGMDIVVEAGIKPSVFTDKLGLTTSSNNILFRGKVSRIVPQYNGVNPSAHLLLSSIMLDNQGGEKSSTADNDKKSEEGYNFIVEKGDVIADATVKTLNNMFGDLAIEILDSAKNVTLQDTQTLQRNVKDFNELVKLVKSLGVGIAVEATQIALYGINAGLKREAKTFEPKLQDFLSQPEYQNASTIQCAFGLRGDLRLGTKIKMPNNTIMSGGSLLSQSGSLAGISNVNAVIASGEYNITGIWHTGDSRNSSALSWATTISATNTTNLSNK